VNILRLVTEKAGEGGPARSLTPGDLPNQQLSNSTQNISTAPKLDETANSVVTATVLAANQTKKAEQNGNHSAGYTNCININSSNNQ
jgi:hypothetical protein